MSRKRSRWTPDRFAIMQPGGGLEYRYGRIYSSTKGPRLYSEGVRHVQVGDAVMARGEWHTVAWKGQSRHGGPVVRLRPTAAPGTFDSSSTEEERGESMDMKEFADTAKKGDTVRVTVEMKLASNPQRKATGVGAGTRYLDLTTRLKFGGPVFTLEVPEEGVESSFEVVEPKSRFSDAAVAQALNTYYQQNAPTHGGYSAMSMKHMRRALDFALANLEDEEA